MALLPTPTDISFLSYCKKSSVWPLIDLSCHWITWPFCLKKFPYPIHYLSQNIKCVRPCHWKLLLFEYFAIIGHIWPWVTFAAKKKPRCTSAAHGLSVYPHMTVVPCTGSEEMRPQDCRNTHTHIHTHIHLHIHTYTHTYIHTYIHTYTRTPAGPHRFLMLLASEPKMPPRLQEMITFQAFILIISKLIWITYTIAYRPIYPGHPGVAVISPSGNGF